MSLLQYLNNPAVLADDAARKRFAQELMIAFKVRNIQEGINAPQAMWLHHRIRALDTTITGVAMTVDLSNMAMSGDLETAYLALAGCAADDMSQAYHSLSQERLNWMKTEIAIFLGWA